MHALALISSSCAEAEALERRRKLGLVDARMRQQVPILACLASDDLRETYRGGYGALVASVGIDHSEECSHLVEDLRCDVLRAQAGPAPARPSSRETARARYRAVDQLAKQVSAVSRHGLSSILCAN